MAYDERLADHVRELIGERTNVTERRMFGGLTFMVRGGAAGSGVLLCGRRCGATPRERRS
ncbi:MAG: hypothetical protein ACXVHB_31095 [Solirubrobacteraceae bacterium]